MSDNKMTVIDGAKTLKIDVTLTGHGLVNFGGPDDRRNLKFATRNEDGTFSVGASIHDNAKYGKANAVLGADGGIVLKHKISSNSLRGAIFGYGSNSAPMLDDEAVISTVSSPNVLLRGYMSAVHGKETTKKKGAVSVMDAMLANGAVPAMETCVTSGAKDSNSLFSVETVGETVWKFRMIVDLSELAFIALTDVRDRRAVPHGLEHRFAARLSDRFGENFEITQYRKADSTSDVPETGILLGDRAITTCVNYLLDHVYGINILRANGYAEFSEASVEVVRGGNHVYDPVRLALKPGDHIELRGCDLEYVVDTEHADREQKQLEYLAEKAKAPKKDKGKKTKTDKEPAEDK